MDGVAHAAHEVVIVRPGLTGAGRAVVRAGAPRPDEQASTLDTPVGGASHALCIAS